MTTTEPNWDLLFGTARHIITRPKEWDQSSWMCGTTACFAGHAVKLSGFDMSERQKAKDPGYAPSILMGLSPEHTERVKVLGILRVDHRTFYDGDTDGTGWVPISELATKLLGLEDEDADRIYAGSLDLFGLLSQVDRIAALWDKDLPEDIALAMEAALDEAEAEDGF